MDELSNLLNEAKPLYKRRKRRKAIAKSILALAVPTILMSSICQVCLEGNDIYISLENDTLQNELMEDEFGLLGL